MITDLEHLKSMASMEGDTTVYIETVKTDEWNEELIDFAQNNYQNGWLAGYLYGLRQELNRINNQTKKIQLFTIIFAVILISLFLIR